MNISARNHFAGHVAGIKPGAIQSEVDVLLPGGQHVFATITNDAVQYLGLVPGKAVTALVKASSVLVMTGDDGLRLSARNCLAGTVSSLVDGPVSTEVGISLPDGLTVYATITHTAVQALGLAVGSAATAVFKAPAVIIAASA